MIMDKAFLLTKVWAGGFRAVVLVADSMDELVRLLTANGYYFSKEVGRFIDDANGKSSGVDYQIEVSSKHEEGSDVIPSY